MVKVRVDRARCIGAGQCVRTVPEVFDQSEADGIVKLLVAEPSPEHALKVRKAVRLCPAQAIRIEDE